jgi:hypothetical protein
MQTVTIDVRGLMKQGAKESEKEIEALKREIVLLTKLFELQEEALNRYEIIINKYQKKEIDRVNRKRN